MEIANLSANKLRDVIKQLERRDALLEQVKQIEGKLGEFLGSTGSKPAPKAKRKVTRRRRKSAKSGALKAASGRRSVAPKSLPSIEAPKAIRAAKSARPATAAKAAKPAKAVKSGRRGALKSKILAELNAAGSAGVAVRDLAAKLKIKPQNVHVWFSSTGKNVPGLIRLGEGRYRLNA